jgi:molybdopterin converting factor small subunit
VSASEIRVDVFAALQELSEVIPEMRTGQLMAAVGELCSDLHGRGLWDAEDDELFEAVWQFRRNYEAVVTASREGA